MPGVCHHMSSTTPGNGDVMAMRAVAYYELGYYEQSKQDLGKALRIDPQSPIVISANNYLSAAKN